MSLKEPPQATTVEATEAAQRFLLSALDSVKDVLQARQVVRDGLRAVGGKSASGAPSGAEQDLCRAAIVFAAAGLDATLKQLIREALPDILAVSSTAQDNFEKFVAKQLSSNSDEVRPGPLAQLLISVSPRDTLLSSYLYDLTGSSLQSTEEVHRTVAALGVESKGLTQQIVSLKPLFVARNEIAHELDLLHVREKGDRRRRGRPLATTESLCDSAFVIGQAILNEVAMLLGGQPPSAPPPKTSAKKSSTTKKASAKKAPPGAQ